MNPPSDTPRTDALNRSNLSKELLDRFSDSNELARQLERELNAARESAVENSRFVIQLLEYARHGPNCPMPYKSGCDCGLEELLSKIKPPAIRTATAPDRG